MSTAKVKIRSPAKRMEKRVKDALYRKINYTEIMRKQRERRLIEQSNGLTA